MSNWKHILLEGEYPERARILDGLTSEQIGQRPPGAHRSIYEELWHLKTWQDVVLAKDNDLYEAWMKSTRYPEGQVPSTDDMFEQLGEEFLAGIQKIVDLTGSEENLAEEIAPGIVFRDVVESLAVHNAYHLGKIVALRQALGCWVSRG
ncbi:DinB family protein [Candidatus Eisenbacteria bacterium]|uniref:DinB family protein n=1 Tax=Eiseniibacteriota bacterium TaxID=2212470 RepID=A0ABV6YJR5_UNCEI